ncbi:MAG: hypothetical protein N2314_02390 [Brevinematales bacterium]|nr:hypothetical protein [Brevinematales bacterium]
MRRKWLLIVCSVGFVFSLAGCGRIIRQREPFVYKFSVGQTLRYRFRGESQLSLEAGLVGYQGTIVITGDLYLTPVAFTNGEYFFHMLIKDVNIENADRSLAGGIYGYINYLSTTFYEWYMTPSGKITVYYRHLPVYPLQWFANMVIVDVSQWDDLIGQGEERTTNFSALFQNQEMTVETSLFQRLVGATADTYVIAQQYTYTAYREKAFPLANLEVHMETRLGRKIHRMISKSGNFQFQGSVPFLRQGIFSLSARFQGLGKFTLEEEPLQ